MTVLQVLLLLTFTCLTFGQIMPGTSPSSPSMVVYNCLSAAIKGQNFTSKYPKYTYSHDIDKWCSAYDETLECINSTLPEKRSKTDGDWFLSLIFDHDMAKTTSDRVCAAFTAESANLTCLNTRMANITFYIDVLVNRRIGTIPPLSMILYGLYRAKLFNDENADNTACLAATHTARIFHENALLACNSRLTHIITEYYMILNGKCDTVLNQRVERPKIPKETIISVERNATDRVASVDGNQTFTELDVFSAVDMATKLKRKAFRFRKIVKAIENHRFMKYLESIKQDAALKKRLKAVKFLKNPGLAVRLLRMLTRMHKRHLRRMRRKRRMQEEALIEGLLLAADNSTTNDTYLGTENAPSELVINISADLGPGNTAESGNTLEASAPALRGSKDPMPKKNVV